MEKKYLILKLETKESLIPNGYDVTTRTEYHGATYGYPFLFDTVEEAEQNLPDEKYDQYTIIPIYSK